MYCAVCILTASSQITQMTTIGVIWFGNLIKPYSFANDDKYNTISPSLRIDICPKNLDLAPNKPIRIYNAAKLQHKFNTKSKVSEIVFNFIMNNLFEKCCKTERD